MKSCSSCTVAFVCWLLVSVWLPTSESEAAVSFWDRWRREQRSVVAGTAQGTVSVTPKHQGKADVKVPDFTLALWDVDRSFLDPPSGSSAHKRHIQQRRVSGFAISNFADQTTLRPESTMQDPSEVTFANVLERARRRNSTIATTLRNREEDPDETTALLDSVATETDEGGTTTVPSSRTTSTKSPIPRLDGRSSTERTRLRSSWGRSLLSTVKLRPKVLNFEQVMKLQKDWVRSRTTRSDTSVPDTSTPMTSLFTAPQGLRSESMTEATIDLGLTSPPSLRSNRHSELLDYEYLDYSPSEDKETTMATEIRNDTSDTSSTASSSSSSSSTTTTTATSTTTSTTTTTDSLFTDTTFDWPGVTEAAFGVPDSRSPRTTSENEWQNSEQHLEASEDYDDTKIGQYYEVRPGQYYESHPGQYHEVNPGQYHEVNPGQYHEQSPGQYHEQHPGQYHETNPGQYTDLDVQVEVQHTDDTQVYNVQSKVDNFIIGEYGTISKTDGQTIQGVRYTAVDDHSVNPQLILATIKKYFPMLSNQPDHAEDEDAQLAA